MGPPTSNILDISLCMTYIFKRSFLKYHNLVLQGSANSYSIPNEVFRKCAKNFIRLLFAVGSTAPDFRNTQGTLKLTETQFARVVFVDLQENPRFFVTGSAYLGIFFLGSWTSWTWTIRTTIHLAKPLAEAPETKSITETSHSHVWHTFINFYPFDNVSSQKNMTYWFILDCPPLVQQRLTQ